MSDIQIVARDSTGKPRLAIKRMRTKAFGLYDVSAGGMVEPIVLPCRTWLQVGEMLRELADSADRCEP